MNLYLIRHAKAIERSKSMPDEWRCLTEQGRIEFKKTRSMIAKQDIKPHLIITSPLVRAVQTAELLADKLKQINIVITNGNLLPNADIYQLISYLKKLKASKSIMLIGHEPLLGALVSELLCQPDAGITLKKGACIALNVHFGKKNKAKFLWYLAPGKKPIYSLEKAFL